MEKDYTEIIELVRKFFKDAENRIINCDGVEGSINEKYINNKKGLEYNVNYQPNDERYSRAKSKTDNDFDNESYSVIITLDFDNQVYGYDRIISWHDYINGGYSTQAEDSTNSLSKFFTDLINEPFYQEWYSKDIINQIVDWEMKQKLSS